MTPTTTFGIRVPIVLGTPTINRVIAMMKESDLHNAPHEWQACHVSHDAAEGFTVGRVSLDPGGKFPTNTGGNPTDLDETVRLTTKCMVPWLPNGRGTRQNRTNYDDRRAALARVNPGTLPRRSGGAP